MDTKKLRQKILDLAIRGKLVPQDPNDEPASVLLQRIKAEKERLIKEGKIKRSKKSASDTSHYENVPFEVPESWEWIRLEEFVLAVTDGDHLPPPQVLKGIPFLVISDVNTGVISFDKARFVSESYYHSLPDIRKATKGDLLFTVTGSYGIVVPVETEREFCFQRHIGLIKIIECSSWILYVLQSNYVQTYCDKVATGTAQKTVSLGHLRDLLIPIPPLDEQERIVSQLDVWLDAVGKLQNSEKELRQAIGKTKSKVLELAISGRLVTQELNDESALELLKRINPDIKIPCDNPHYPFDIPKSWCWVYGSQVFAPMQSCTPNGETFKYIDIDTIDNKNNSILSAKILPTKDAPSRASRFTMKDDTLFSMVRPYLRNIAMVKEDDCIASTGFYVCRSNGSLLAKYCFYMMLSSYVVDGLNFFMKGDNSPSINRSHIESFIYPLPPLAEQKRIVSEIDRYFNALDRIKESLTA